MAQDNSKVPYRHPQPKESPPELVIPSVIPDDERIWVPQAENVWFRPLCLCASRGYWMNLLRVRKSGVLSRHRHPQPVHGYVIKGRWRYLEHDWVAEEGGYVYEAPGETHTLVVDEDVPEMITLFQVNGVMLYVDPDGAVLGFEDVFTKIALCRAHYERSGWARPMWISSSASVPDSEIRMISISNSRRISELKDTSNLLISSVVSVSKFAPRSISVIWRTSKPRH